MTEIGASAIAHTVAVPGSDGVVTLSWAAATDTGKRRTANEDSFLAQAPAFVVADGMGGHSAGDLASAAVVERLAETVVGDFTTLADVERALTAATDDITVIAADSLLGVGTTATGAVLVLESGDPFFAVFNIGDSRVYAFERNELTQVTVDHSVVQELIESGALSAEDAEFHPDSNVITRAVGFGVPPMADYWMIPARTGLRLLVCSDGLTKEVSADRIRLHLAAGLSPEETAGALIDAALAEGGRDNITAIVVDVLSAPEPSDFEDTQPRAEVSP
ncbi:serine/threonine protein phosphatase PrpC [Microbacteriaceae bacterium SG_E_30_P1]|uniref:Serine/threonine protein phosphatase PrpC n=1 Tax=Antiquaquibacter oligotrophicus TaxID=2880260 RepID=A0ABT6KKP5_9MICO|nr:protein phosphatase 2C domain-containing protein [Antiquaquibacter oligotrophicus]MDH6180570.1 serine/threonine protein phosphatase PrpC [Antiquaquibacter oligotrophicus]UDF13697.1 protein phosphatase 2C domain-containing protein [Antiquaquibacter oligotrophicus]